MHTPETEKLQKVLARAGFGSRRELESWIAQGRVSINGKVATLGDRVSEKDVIRVDGNVVPREKVRGGRRRVLMYHKLVGEVTTRSDPEGRPTVFDHLPNLRNGRWVAVVRLDINTDGLLLFTSDGELAHRLMHPSRQVEREYAVRVMGEVPPEMIKRLQEGVELEDGKAHFDSIVDGGGEGANHWYHVTLLEGRNREVRRLWESHGVVVSRLIRVPAPPMPRGDLPGDEVRHAPSDGGPRSRQEARPERDHRREGGTVPARKATHLGGREHHGREHLHAGGEKVLRPGCVVGPPTLQ